MVVKCSVPFLVRGALHSALLTVAMEARMEGFIPPVGSGSRAMTPFYNFKLKKFKNKFYFI